MKLGDKVKVGRINNIHDSGEFYLKIMKTKNTENKYTEALKWFTSIHNAIGKEEYYNDLGMRFGQGLDESIETFEELIQEHIKPKQHYARLFNERDKETPLKPINQEIIDWGLGNAGNCKTCKRDVNYQNKYCDNCGQRLDWSGFDE